MIFTLQFGKRTNWIIDGLWTILMILLKTTMILRVLCQDVVHVIIIPIFQTHFFYLGKYRWKIKVTELFFI